MSAPPTSGATDRSLAPAVAGRWYPSDPGELRRLVDELLAAPAAAFPGSAENVLALIAPHAGYRYSGAVAARGFSAVAGRRFERVIVIGPSHYVGFAGAAVPDAESYRTPLGAVALDVPALDELRARPEFRSDSGVFAREHSLLPNARPCSDWLGRRWKSAWAGPVRWRKGSKAPGSRRRSWRSAQPS